MAETSVGITPGTGKTIDGFDAGTGMRQAIVIADSAAPAATVAVQQFHNADNQAPGANAYGLLTGGVAQLLNATGNIDRQRETGFDGIPASGIATGTQQLAAPVTTTAATSIATGIQIVTPASMTNIQVGSSISVANSNATNKETVYVTAVTTTTFTANFVSAKTGPGITLNFFVYNQARDASIGDLVPGLGLSPSATYLYNQNTQLYEIDRSASGELDGATGRGTAVAAEYEYNGGGPITNAGTSSLLAFDRARNLQGKGIGTATQNAGGGIGTTSVTVSVATATNTLQPGEQIRIDRNTVTEESAYVTAAYVPGTALIPVQSALQFTHTAATVEWDNFASAGPGLNGFTPAGIGIEEEALYNPVDGKYYIERSATQDGVVPANVVLESLALWNGTTMDRLKGTNGAASVNSATLIAGEDLTNNILKVNEVFSITNITTNTTTTSKTGSGLLHTITVNNPSALTIAALTISVFDNSAGSGTSLGIFTVPFGQAGALPFSILLDCAFSTGLTIVTAGPTVAANISVNWR